MSRLQILLGLGLLITPEVANASGFSVAHFASEHGHPTTSNPTAVYFNPAALTLSDGLHLFGDLSVAVRRVTYDRTRAPTDAPRSAGRSGRQRGPCGARESARQSGLGGFR